MVVMTPDNAATFAGITISRSNKLDTGLCLGIYGIGGSGKTTELSKIVLSEHGTPALLVSIDGSHTSVLHLTDHGLDIVTPKNWNEVVSIHKAFKKGDHRYKSIIYDNLSVLAKWCMKGVTTLEVPQIQHWGQMTSRMFELVQECQDLSRIGGYNTLFVLWEDIEIDELTKIIRRKVELSAKLGAGVPGIVTMMGRLTVPGDAKSNYIRQLSFAPSEKTDAKFRVSPTEHAANIPLELYLKSDSTFLADFLATIKEGKPFPTDKYKKPVLATNAQQT